MNSLKLSVFSRRIIIALVCIVFFLLPFQEGSPATAKKKGRAVWLVFFFSKDCPHCESVKDLTKALSGKYPVRVKNFNIDDQADYAVYSKLEAIHARDKFSVPLIMVGDEILMGETEIAGKLEEKIRGLNAAGGSGLPYLGKAFSKTPAVKSPCPDCDSEGRPKRRSPGDGSGKMKIFEDKSF